MTETERGYNVLLRLCNSPVSDPFPLISPRGHGATGPRPSGPLSQVLLVMSTEASASFFSFFFSSSLKKRRGNMPRMHPIPTPRALPCQPDQKTCYMWVLMLWRNGQSSSGCVSLHSFSDRMGADREERGEKLPHFSAADQGTKPLENNMTMI